MLPSGWEKAALERQGIVAVRIFAMKIIVLGLLFSTIFTKLIGVGPVVFYNFLMFELFYHLCLRIFRLI